MKSFDPMIVVAIAFGILYGLGLSRLVDVGSWLFLVLAIAGSFLMAILLHVPDWLMDDGDEFDSYLQEAKDVEKYEQRLVDHGRKKK